MENAKANLLLKLATLEISCLKRNLYFEIMESLGIEEILVMQELDMGIRLGHPLHGPSRHDLGLV